MKVLVTPRSFGKSDPTLFAELEAMGFEIVKNDTGAILSADLMREKIRDCEAVILGVDPCHKDVLDCAPKLQVIARYGVGTDNIDLDTCKERNITVSRTVGANSNAVADFAFGLLLACARKICLIDKLCREDNWSKNTAIDVFNKTIGIVGLGAVGKCMAKRAAGFGMKILAADPYMDEAFAKEYNIQAVDVDTLCAQADFISLHTVLTPETSQLINAERLARMKKNAIVINTARGELVDEEALFQALQEKRIYGAGLDVFCHEPPLKKEWYTLDNVVLSSHTASSTVGTTNLMGRMCVDALKQAFGKE